MRHGSVVTVNFSPIRLESSDRFNMSAREVAQQFATHYYGIFDGNRAQLANLYVSTILFFEQIVARTLIFEHHHFQQQSSMMSWEGAELVGASAIMDKLGSLPSMKHQVVTVDAQAISNNNMIVYVTGKLSVG